MRFKGCVLRSNHKGNLFFVIWVLLEILSISFNIMVRNCIRDGLCKKSCKIILKHFYCEIWVQGHVLKLFWHYINKIIYIYRACLEELHVSYVTANISIFKMCLFWDIYLYLKYRPSCKRGTCYSYCSSIFQIVLKL